MSMKLHPIYSNFRGGEISPRSLGRVDLELRNQSLLHMQNMIVQVQGGAFRRPPTIHVASTKYADKKCRLLPFETSLLVPYMVEMGDEYFRFFRNGQPICTETGGELVTNGTFGANITGWDDLSTGTGAISWHASAYMLLTPGTGIAWAEQDIATTAGTHYRVDFTAITSPVKLRIGTSPGAEDVLSDLEFAAGANTFDFEAASSTTYIQFRRTSGAAGGVDTVEVHALTPYEITTSPYLEAELPDIDVRMTPEGMFFFHRMHAPMILSTTADATWSLDLWDYLNGPAMAKRTIGMTISGTSGERTLTCTGDVFFKAHEGGIWRLKTDEGNYFSVRMHEYLTTKTFKVIPVETLDSVTITAWREGCWSDYRGWPRTGAFFEDRLVVAATIYEPQAVWGSRSPDPEAATERWRDFTAERATLDSDLIYFTLNGNSLGADVIQALGVLDPLVVMTAAGEITMAGVQGPVTPTAVKVKAGTTYGSAPRTPVRIGNSLIFLDKTTRKLRTFFYNWEQENHSSLDLNDWAEHITEGGINYFVHMKMEVPTLWATRNDGVLLCTTIDASRDTNAWGRHIIGGTDAEVESIAVAERAVSAVAADYATPDKLRNELWMVVKRTIGGDTVRYIERMAEQLPDSYSDSQKSWSGLAAITTMVGLLHLAGESVEAMVDGVYQGLKTVSASGQITLSPGGLEIIAGLASIPIMETVPPEIQLQTGTVQGKMKSWAYASAYLYETPSCYINGKLVTADSSDWVEILNLGWSKDNRIIITQAGPLPLNVLAISGDLEITQ